MIKKLSELHKEAFLYLLDAEKPFTHENYSKFLIQKGVVVPKFTIGQNVFYIEPDMPKCLIEVEKLEVFKICTQIDKFSNIDQTYVCLTKSRSLRFIKNEEINKNAFCSKEEAEEALTKRKE